MNKHFTDTEVQNLKEENIRLRVNLEHATRGLEMIRAIPAWCLHDSVNEVLDEALKAIGRIKK